LIHQNTISPLNTLGAVTFDATSAAYFLDAELKALEPGKVYNYPNGTVIRSYEAGSIVGEVFSWVMRGDILWWQLKEGGFVSHQKGKFDATIAKNTSQGKADEILTAAFNSGNFELPNLDQLKKMGFIALGVIGGTWAISLYLQSRAAKHLSKKLTNKKP
jgi:hypothetical protein